MHCRGEWCITGWQKLREGPSPKSLDLHENFKPQHTLSCHNIIISRDLRTFWKNFGKKKCSFGSKTVFLGQKVPFALNHVQTRRIFRENSKYVPHEIFCGHFCPRQKAANFCHPGQWHAWHLHQSYYLKKNPGADQAIQHLYVSRCNDTIWFWRDLMFCSHFCFLTFSWPFAKSL